MHTLSLQTVLNGRAERLPLDLALQAALEVVTAVVAAHAHGRVAGTLDATSFAPDTAGRLTLQPGRGARLAPELVGGAPADVPSDLYATGVVLYQLLTGLTPAEARGRLVIPTIYAVPLPSLINPTVDEALEEVVLALLERDPGERPHAASAVRAVLESVMEELDVSPDAAVVGALFRPAAPVAPPPLPPRPAHRIARARWQEDDGEDDDVADEVAWVEPVRFDGWAAAAAGLVVVAVTLIGVVI